ncbi:MULTISPECIES: outer membrane beta-barrel protein [Aequorivita]|uniref:Outer membrane beta-barrel protein n=2 Tax=Aequorivita TaxID=153265 RepID=A0AB35YN18_9FLAO|nr:outer membrane beta-barrel protein [Aequorivita sp. Ant34-E75]WGF93589.1 hypothetical protein QCQ61_05195 [Aequorivita sp. Ant34-E75]
MKKVIILVLFLLSSITYGQIQKGESLLSLSASPYPTTTNNKNDFGILGLASFEFFAFKNISLSGTFSISNNTLFKNNSQVTIHSYSFIPSAHYYFINKKKWNVFAQIGYGYGFEDQTQGVIQNSALTIFNIGTGAHYNINEAWFLKLLLPYFDANNITLNVDAASGIAVFIGGGIKL